MLATCITFVHQNLVQEYALFRPGCFHFLDFKAAERAFGKIEKKYIYSGTQTGNISVSYGGILIKELPK